MQSKSSKKNLSETSVQESRATAPSVDAPTTAKTKSKRTAEIKSTPSVPSRIRAKREAPQSLPASGASAHPLNEIVSLNEKISALQADLVVANELREAERLAASNTVTQKEAQLKSQEEQLGVLTQELEKLQLAFKTLVKTQEATQLELAKETQEGKQQQALLKSRENEIQALNKKSDGQHIELAQLKTRLEADKALAEKNLAAKLAEIEQQTKQLKAQSQEQEKLQKLLATNLQELSASQAETTALRQDVAYLQEALGERDADNQLLTIQLHKAQEELENLYMEARKTRETQLKELAELKSQHDLKLGELKSITKANHENQEALAQLEKNHADQITQLNRNKEKLASVTNELTQKSAQLKAQEEALQSLEKKFIALHAEYERQLGETSKLQGLLAAHENCVHEAETENELLLAQLFQVQEELERYFLGNQASRDLLDQYRQSLQISRLQLAKLFKQTIQ